MQGHPVVANIVLIRTVTTERVLELNAYTDPDGYIGPIFAGQYSRREGDNSIEGSFSATTAPRKVIHTNSQRDSSSLTEMPELKA